MSELRVIPLGGLGEIGLNLMVLEYGDAAIAVDCGVMFPDEHTPGIDKAIPDITYLRGLGNKLKGIVLTHAHEDHIGALPYVLNDLRVPVYGTPLTLGFVGNRLREYELNARLERFGRGLTDLGPFGIEPIAMTHSIPDAVGLAIKTPVGMVIHTGDFKIDHTPLDGRTSDLRRLAELGREGVALLMSDSTNVEHEGHTASERSVGAHLEGIFREAPGRMIVTTFSSHIHRMQQVIDLSAQFGRKVALVGRSMLANVAVARDLGLLRVPEGLLVEPGQMRDMPRQQVTMIIAGSQAEAASALVRIAMNAHKQVRLDPGDTVIMSSRVIPGNERPVASLVNHLYRRGAIVHYDRHAPIHVSGHAAQDELKMVIDLVRPQHFVPIHGEYRHLIRHCRLATDMGVGMGNCHLLEDGDVLAMDGRTTWRPDRVRAGRVFVDGTSVGDVGDVVLRDRRHLAEDGLVLAVIAIAHQTGEIVTGPDLVSRGVVSEESGPEVMDGARAAIVAALNQINPESRGDTAEVQEETRKALRRYFRKLERRPVILPFVLEM